MYSRRAVTTETLSTSLFPSESQTQNVSLAV